MSRVLKSIYKHKVPTIIYKKRALKKKSFVVCYQGILEKNGVWLNLFILWLATPILPWKSSNLLQISPEKAWNDWMKPPWIDERYFFSTIIAKKQNKTLQIVLCHKRIISSEIQNFQKKTKEKIYNFVFPHKNPAI